LTLQKLHQGEDNVASRLVSVLEWLNEFGRRKKVELNATAFHRQGVVKQQKICLSTRSLKRCPVPSHNLRIILTLRPSLNPQILKLNLHPFSLGRASHDPNENLLPLLQEVGNLSNHRPAVLGKLGVDSNERSSSRDLERGEGGWADGR